MKPDHIIIHHSLTADSQTVSWDAIRWYHRSLGWTDIGYHAGIELVGNRYEILLGRMLEQPGAHTVGMNDRSVGICMVGNFDLGPPRAAQLDLLVRYVRSVMGLLEIPVERVTRHSDYASKTCPGLQFPWAHFIERIK